jgi:hypothetical protein
VARRTGRPSQAPKAPRLVPPPERRWPPAAAPPAGTRARRGSPAVARSRSPEPGARAPPAADRRASDRRARRRRWTPDVPLGSDRSGSGSPIRSVRSTAQSSATSPARGRRVRKPRACGEGSARGTAAAPRVCGWHGGYPDPARSSDGRAGFVSLFAPADAPAPIRGKPVRHRPTPSPSRPRLDPRARPDCPARASLPAPEAFGRGEADLPSRAAAPTSLGAEAGAGALLRACPSTGTRMLFTIL